MCPAPARAGRAAAQIASSPTRHTAPTASAPTCAAAASHTIPEKTDQQPNAVSETNLFKNIFSQDPPKPGQPRLRLMANDGSDTFRSLHRGAMSFAEGCYAGIRNPSSHEDGLPELPEHHQALEQLAAFSVLAHWVASAAVES
ncbi:TIGR02391 family protein [Streptomyces malaysiensis]|uniref:TIGR02391 family protein n=1 Tax=Streptomyces malaysiensis TaxID=92644 RepID=UPI003D9DE378